MKLGRYEKKFSFQGRNSDEHALKVFEEILTIQKQTQQIDESFVQALGDYGELLHWREDHAAALQVFEYVKNLSEELLAVYNYNPYLPNDNERALREGVQIAQDYQLTAEQAEEIQKIQDRGGQPDPKGAKGGAAKKDDGKTAKKVDPKTAQQLKGKQQIDESVQELKVECLNKIPPFDFTQDPKIGFNPPDIEKISNTRHTYNILTPHVLLHFKAVIRYVNSYLLNLRDGENVRKKNDSTKFKIPTKLSFYPPNYPSPPTISRHSSRGSNRSRLSRRTC